MTHRKSFFLLGLALFLAVGVFVLERPDLPRHGDVRGDLLLPRFNAPEVKRVEFEHLIGGVQLERDGDSWKVARLTTVIQRDLASQDGKPSPDETQPSWYRADRGRVNNALGIFGDLTRGVLASSNPDKQTLYHVGSTGQRLRFFDVHGKQLAELIIGKNGPDFTSNYVRLAEDNNVYLVNRTLQGIFSPEVNDWRDRLIWHFDPIDIVGLEVERKDETFKLAKGNDGLWSLVTPQNSPIDEAKVSTLIGKIADLQASGFSSEAPETATGDVEKPYFMLSITTNQGKKQTLIVDKKAEHGNYRAWLQENPYRYLLPEAVISAVPDSWQSLAASASAKR